MPNFKEFGAFFVIFEIFNTKIGFFSLCVAPVALGFCWEHPFAKRFAFLESWWKNMHAQEWLRFLDKFWVSKRARNIKKVPSLPLFFQIGSSLGRFHFLRANELQIQKFKIFHKVDTPIIPTSYPTPDLVFGKPSKSGPEKMLCIGSVMVHIAEILLVLPICS